MPCSVNVWQVPEQYFIKQKYHSIINEKQHGHRGMSCKNYKITKKKNKKGMTANLTMEQHAKREMTTFTSYVASYAYYILNN